ncbi:MAG: nucleotidyltransferase domain-containing protein [Candidatus Methanoperedens sp.]|nr:nucleotidyltransferase domain-containing protein [Candidatus Methanoperedens sp.]MCZ7394702.1 nucleotidyltransferase domain-containing protein [Candidatus Methanoperedens sp.]
MSNTKPRIDIPRDMIVEFCKKWKIREFSLFGSVLREDFRPDSDVDVLVTFSEDAKHTMFDLVHMEDELKQILGRDVDIVSRRGIESSRNYIRRNAILNSAEAVSLEKIVAAKEKSLFGPMSKTELSDLRDDKDRI